ncbi:hypothetical protein EB796_004830 [Bugula neritina]|uniref:EGF-like domain-containing protein n=1 Tax=Bugula neritina TaxID=10212 RepID=A0A7J7KG11_BUGNE|nr:hypothetical protein EB796_004830 [Bugula neritina]
MVVCDLKKGIKRTTDVAMYNEETLTLSLPGLFIPSNVKFVNRFCFINGIWYINLSEESIMAYELRFALWFLIAILFGHIAGDVTITGAPGATGDVGDIGKTGPTGLPGLPGADGPTGPKGQKGEKGEQGMTGATGEAGPDGAKGELGATGSTGAVGVVGEEGLTGEVGQKGEIGASGQKGEPGVKGEIGPVGKVGPQAAAGPNGIKGVQGDMGAKGNVGLQGLQGVAGDKGDQGANGIADTNECLNTAVAACPEEAECINHLLGFDCKCPAGYNYDTDKGVCEDENECLNDLANCDNACENTEGSYNCFCNIPGFVLSPKDLHSCIDENECESLVPCAEGEECVNTYGSYVCVNILAETSTAQGQVSGTAMQNNLVSTPMLVVLVVWAAALTVLLIVVTIILILKRENYIAEQKSLVKSRSSSR